MIIPNLECYFITINCMIVKSLTTEGKIFSENIVLIKMNTWILRAYLTRTR